MIVLNYLFLNFPKQSNNPNAFINSITCAIFFNNSFFHDYVIKKLKGGDILGNLLTVTDFILFISKPVIFWHDPNIFTV